MKGSRIHLCRNLYYLMTDLLEKVKQFIEEERYNGLEVIYNAESAKLGKCAVISKTILLAEDLSASSDIPKNDACFRVMSDKSRSCKQAIF